MRTTFALSLAGAIAMSLAAFAQTPNLRPGKYETTSAISLPGSPTKMPRRTDEACLTADDVKDLSKRLVRNDQKGNCTLSNSKVTGTALAFTMECTVSDGLKMLYTGDVTFPSSESYHAVVTMKDTSGRATNPMMRGSTITTTAKRIGECTK